MRNQAFLLAALAAVVIGCGGGGHHSSSSGSTTSTTGTTPGTTTGTTSTAAGFTVAFPTGNTSVYGRVEVEYLTGQGRAQNDLYLTISRQRIQNGDGIDVYDNSAESLVSSNLDLNGFQTISKGIDIPVTGASNSLLLQQLVIDPNAVKVEDSSGNLQNVPDSPDDNVTNGLPLAGSVIIDALGDRVTLTGTPSTANAEAFPYPVESRIRAFPGRVSVVQVRLSNASFHPYQDSNGNNYFTTNINTGASTGIPAYVFDLNQFTILNTNPSPSTDPTGQGLLASRLSDFVRFDLSHLADADKPQMRTSYDTSVPTSPAGYLYLTGDNIALSTAASGGAFTELEPTSTGDVQDVVIGNWQAKPANTASFTGDFTGTYSLTDAQPIDLNGTPARLVSLYGSFHDYAEILSGGSSFEIVMFPNSGEEYDAQREGDIVAMVRSGTNITSLYSGGVNLSAGTFHLLPIRFLGLPATASTAGAELTGTVSGYVGSTGSTVAKTNLAAVRKFKFTFSGTVPAGVTSSGTVTVLRI